MRFPFRRVNNPPRAVLLAAVLAAVGLASLQLSSAANNGPESTPSDSPAAATAQLVAEQIVVRYKPQADLGALRMAISQAGASENSDLRNLRVKVLKVKPSERQAVLERLRADPRVEYAEPDAIAYADVTRPNDPEYDRQWNWTATLTDVLWDKHKGNNMVIAVVDSGINAGHPDLAGKLVAGYDFVQNDTTPQDDDKHGTMVGGIVGAISNNNLGVAGGCWNCRVMPLRVLDGVNGAAASNIAKAVQFAADNGAKIINLSLSGSGNSEVEQTAIDYATSKGVLVVASAGNESTDEARRPARYDNVISVAATSPLDTLASYSSFGSTVDIAAPGYARTLDFDSNGYVNAEGTSMASPTVAAILAVLWSAFPNATPAALRQAVTASAEPCCGGKIAGGRVNAIKAYNILAGSQNVDTTKPSVSFASPSQNGVVVSGSSVPFVINAADNVGVAKVHLLIDGGSPGFTVSAPYSFSWNSTSATDGSHTVTAVAYDAAGNSTKVDRVVSVNNANPPDTTKPNLTVNGPAAGATVSGSVTVSAEAVDSSGIARLEFLIDDSRAANDAVAPYTFTWNTAQSTNGQHTYKVRAYDSTGNMSEVSRTVTVQNGGTTGNADINADGRVGITDLSILLSAWGTANAGADLNKNGKVDITDLSQLLSAWTR